MSSAFLPEEHSKSWWPCRPSLYSSLSAVVLGHWYVCRLRISLSTLLLGLCFGKLLRHPWVLEGRLGFWVLRCHVPARSRWRLKADLSCGGLLVLGSVDPLFSGGARKSFVWSLERLDRVSLHSLSLFLINVCI